MEAPLSILLVDDSILFRKALAALFKLRSDYRVVGEAADGLEAQAIAHALAPDIILMDIGMPNCDGLEAARRIKQDMPGVRIIMLTVSGQDQDLFEAIKGGCDGYLLKNLEPEQLFEMLEGVKRGEAIIPGPLAARILDEFRQLSTRAGAKAEPPDGVEEPLTEREVDVLKLVAGGLTNKQIAAELSITDNTVKLHLRNILEKLHLQNRVQATVYAIRRGLVDAPADS